MQQEFQPKDEPAATNWASNSFLQVFVHCSSLTRIYLNELLLKNPIMSEALSCSIGPQTTWSDLKIYLNDDSVVFLYLHTKRQTSATFHFMKLGVCLLHDSRVASWNRSEGLEKLPNGNWWSNTDTTKTSMLFQCESKSLEDGYKIISRELYKRPWTLGVSRTVPWNRRRQAKQAEDPKLMTVEIGGCGRGVWKTLNTYFFRQKIRILNFSSKNNTNT